MSQMPAPVDPAPALYAIIMKACAESRQLEDRLVADVAGTLRSEFGIALAAPSSLTRTADGFRFVHGDVVHDLGRPEDFGRSELSDTELDLVSGGKDTNTGVLSPQEYQNAQKVQQEMREGVLQARAQLARLNAGW